MATKKERKGQTLDINGWFVGPGSAPKGVRVRINPQRLLWTQPMLVRSMRHRAAAALTELNRSAQQAPAGCTSWVTHQEYDR